jgi:hypothetical protein
MGRWRRAWQGLTGPMPEDERVEAHRRAQVWQRRLRWIDPEKPPLTVLRWLAVLALAITWWATGAKTSPPHYWVPYVAVAAALILPDIAGFAIGGFRLDLKQAQDEIATLRQDVNAQARATSTAAIAIGNDAITAFTQVLSRAATQTISDQASGAAAPWTPPGRGPLAA